MIVLFTDFSYQGPYVGQLKASILSENSTVKIIDLMHDAPMFKVQYSSLLLGSLINVFPKGSIFCCVIDPGVGSNRNPIVVKVRGNYFIGPDNGLFEYVLRNTESYECYKIIYQPKELSNTFHGRDIFAPTAAMVSQQKFDYLEKIESINRYDWPDSLQSIIYIDSFGNLMTGIHSKDISFQNTIVYQDNQLTYAKTYTEMDKDKHYWYINSSGLVEIAANTHQAAIALNSAIGDTIKVV